MKRVLTVVSARIACRFIFVFKITESSVCVLNVFNFYTVYIQKFPYFIIEPKDIIEGPTGVALSNSLLCELNCFMLLIQCSVSTVKHSLFSFKSCPFLSFMKYNYK